MNIEAGRESGFFYVRPSYSSVIFDTQKKHDLIE